MMSKKNPESIDISKIKTPFKLRNNFLDSSKTNIPKTKLTRKFSAMPKIINNNLNNNPKINKEETVINKKTSKEQSISSLYNLKNFNFNINKNSNINNVSVGNQNILKFKNNIKLFEKQLERRKSIRTNSAKNVNIYFNHIDRSMNMNSKNRKWQLPFKKQNLINNKYIFYNKGNKPNKNLNKNLNSNIMDVKIVSYHNKDKEKDKINKQNIILSFTEHSQNDIFCHKKQKIFPVIL